MIDEIGVTKIEENKETQESMSSISMVKEEDEEESEETAFEDAQIFDISQAYATNRNVVRSKTIMKQPTYAESKISTQSIAKAVTYDGRKISVNPYQGQRRDAVKHKPSSSGFSNLPLIQSEIDKYSQSSRAPLML